MILDNHQVCFSNRAHDIVALPDLDSFNNNVDQEVRLGPGAGAQGRSLTLFPDQSSGFISNHVNHDLPVFEAVPRQTTSTTSAANQRQNTILEASSTAVIPTRIKNNFQTNFQTDFQNSLPLDLNQRRDFVVSARQRQNILIGSRSTFSKPFHHQTFLLPDSFYQTNFDKINPQRRILKNTVIGPSPRQSYMRPRLGFTFPARAHFKHKPEIRVSRQSEKKTLPRKCVGFSGWYQCSSRMK